MNSASDNPEISNRVAGMTDLSLVSENEKIAAASKSQKSGFAFRLQITAFVFILAAIFFLWSAPWRALQCGPDEGMELSKMQLLLHHPGMARLAWNDQSWFYSQIFAAIFSVTGFQCGLPRLMTLIVVIGLLLAFARFMPKGANWLHVLCAWLFFWCWPEMPHLAVSAMLEMPAIGLAVIAAALTPRDRAEWRWWRFILTGIIFAVAVQIKLTALIILPALAAKMIWLWWREIRCRKDDPQLAPDMQKSDWWLSPALGCGVCIILYALIAQWSPDWSWSQLWNSHLAADSTAQANEYRLEPEYLLQSPGTLVAALLGIVVLWRKRRLQEALFPLVLLVTVFIIHINHRPWWYYYGIHFAIPLAILGGWGTAELLREGIRNKTDSPPTKSIFTPEISMMLGALAISLWAGFELSRGYENTLLVSQTQRIMDNDAINELKPYQGQIKWVFSQRGILLAQGGYVQPPELTVLAKKRFWTGNITDKMILDTVKRYQCEALILFSDRELKKKAWIRLVQNKYVKIWTEGSECVFVAKRLDPTPELKRDDLLKRLGL